MAKRRPSGAGMDPVKRKDGRYAARVYMPQSDGSIKPVWVYDRDFEECLRKRDELLARKRDGIPTPSRNSTWSEWLDYWLEEIILKESPYTTYYQYEQCARLHLKPRIGTKRLSSLTVSDVLSLRSRVSQAVSRATANRALTALRSASNAAMRHEILARSVAHLVDFYDEDRDEREVWSREEVRTFFVAIQDHELLAAFLLVLIMGLRRAEVRGLRWEDVDLERRIIYVRMQRQRLKVPGKEIREVEYKPKGKGRRKNNKGAIGLPEILVRPLQERREYQRIGRQRAGSAWVEHGLVFTGETGRPIGKDALYRAFVSLTEELGLPRIRLHDLRHGASTMLADTGALPHVAKGILGHTSITTTMDVYTHAALQSQREALDRMVDHLTDVSSGCQEANDTPLTREDEV